MTCLSLTFVLAYIDPGSGSFLLQLILGAIFGGLMVLKLTWRKIFRKNRQDPPSDDDQHSD